MIRTSRHNISKNTNKGKLDSLDLLFDVYKKDLVSYIELISEGILPLKLNLSSKDLPSIGITHSRYKQLIYKHASEIVRSQQKKVYEKRYRIYKKVYSYFKGNGRQVEFVSKRFSDLKLKDSIKTRGFVIPDIKSLTIGLDERFFDIKFDSSFDGFVKIILPFFNEKGTRALQVKVPISHHKHSKTFVDKQFSLRKAIQIKKIGSVIYMNLIWEKEIEKTNNKKQIGIDTGFRRLIYTSENQQIGSEINDIYRKILKKQKNSNAYKKTLLLRDNLIKKYVNQIDLSDVGVVCVEDLCNVKYKSKYNNKVNDLMARWTYRPLLDRIEMTCEAKGISLVKVSPQYTSQTCSSCGYVHEESRKGDSFKCVECGFEIDADYNAAINIRNKGAIVPLCEKEDALEFVCLG